MEFGAPVAPVRGPQARGFGVLGDTSRDVILLVPLGLAIGLLDPSPATARVLVAVLALPLAIEAIRSLLPMLGRGFQSRDVVDNLLGLGIGLAFRRVCGGEGSTKEAISPHGYPGNVLNEDGAATEDFPDACVTACLDALRDVDVCTAFVRLHPLLNAPLGNQRTDHETSVKLPIG